MRKVVVVAAILAVSFAGCKKNKLDITKCAPKCIEKKIGSFEKEQNCDDGLSVSKYTFQGESVYVFFPGTCGLDASSGVYDEDCNYLGGLGGIAGNVEY